MILSNATSFSTVCCSDIGNHSLKNFYHYSACFLREWFHTEVLNKYIMETWHVQHNFLNNELAVPFRTFVIYPWGTFFVSLNVKSSPILVLGIVNFLWAKFHYFHSVPFCTFCFIQFRCEYFPAFPCLDRHFSLWYDPFTNFCSTTEYSKGPPPYRWATHQLRKSFSIYHSEE